MTVTVNVHRGLAVSPSQTGGAATLADLNARADRVEKAIQILVEAGGEKARNKHLQKFGGGRPDERSEAAAMAGTRDAMSHSPTQRRHRQMRDTNQEIRRIAEINDNHYRGAR